MDFFDWSSCANELLTIYSWLRRNQSSTNWNRNYAWTKYCDLHTTKSTPFPTVCTYYCYNITRTTQRPLRSWSNLEAASLMERDLSTSPMSWWEEVFVAFCDPQHPKHLFVLCLEPAVRVQPQWLERRPGVCIQTSYRSKSGTIKR